MTRPNPLADLPARHYRDGCGIYSVCSAHPASLEAGVAAALRDGSPLLIEATSNQVDQFGGYTGMVPAAFRKWVEEFAGRLGLPGERLILGGDHLGPNPWRREPAAQAMDKARELVRQYVAAGFTKIHLDCSMALGGDAGPAPSQETVAARAAELCRVAEDAAAAHVNGAAGGVMPVYVVGTEVPIPGGVMHDIESTLEVTRIADAEETLETHKRVFAKAGLEDAWSRVIAMVVQPGVEFGNYTVAEYDREKAKELSAFIAKRGDMLFEAHSTDYQTQQGLDDLVKDHYAVLKVGPWLTYAYREALYGLDAISRELGGTADVRGTVEAAMLESPGYWQGHYHGGNAELRLARVFSFSDRVRYYWPNAKIQAAIGRLMTELSAREIPLSLLSQYLPVQYEEARNGAAGVNPRDPHSLIRSAVLRIMTMFTSAVGMTKKQ